MENENLTYISENSENNNSSMNLKSPKSSKIKKQKTHNKNTNSKDFHKFKYKSNNNGLSKSAKLEKHEVPILQTKNIHTDSYNKELYNKYINFLQSKKFRISNEFDAKNSKKFLEKKNKCMQRIILSDIIENNENDINKSENNEKEHKPKSGRKSANHSNNFCIIISDYDDATKDEIKLNYTVKFAPRKLDHIKKNNHLNKYFINNKESKTQNKLSQYSKSEKKVFI